MGLLSWLRTALGASHEWGAGFDRDVCYGEHPDYPGTCPKLQGEQIHTCGQCGCTIRGLNAADSPPSNCVRLEGHTESRHGG